MRKLHLFSTLVALFCAALPLKADLPEEALSGVFTVNNCGRKVYFSQGNLQYRATADGSGADLTHDVAGGGTAQGIWRFATNQYDFVGDNGKGNVYANSVKCDNCLRTSTYQGWIDLFGWGTSGWDNGNRNAYQPFSLENNNSSYGVEEERSGSEALIGDYANADWGVYNAISNGGNQPGLWRTLTRSEWSYIMEYRTGISTINGTANARYAKAYLFGTTHGLIIFPDNYTHPDGVAQPTGINKQDATSWNANTYNATDWAKMENAGCVFLPITGEIVWGITWSGTSTPVMFYLNEGGERGHYMSVNSNSSCCCYNAIISKEYNQNSYENRCQAAAVRLVQDLPDELQPTLPVASATNAPTAASNWTYDGSEHNLLTAAASGVTGGAVKYRLGTSGDWKNAYNDASFKATNAGTYTVQWYVAHSGCYKDSEIASIEVTVAQADLDLSGVALPGSTSSIPYDGTEKTLLEIEDIPDCTVWYKLGDGEWTTTPPTATNADDYSVQYKIVPDDSNYKTYGPNTVTVTILDYPTVYDNADPTAKLTELLNTPSDLKVKRTIYADDEYNTICLPFALDESALAASPLAGFNRLKTFKGAQVTGTAPDLYIDIFVEDATTIEAGVPYLITYPSAHADIVNPVFTGITVTTTTPSATSADGVTFQGMFAQVHIDPYTSSARDEDYLFLGANSQLYWPSSDQTSSSIKMRGFRAYFIIDRNSISPALAPKGTRARIMDAPKTTTAIDNTSAKFGGSEKIIENGILYIIRNGIRYNAQGQIIK